MATTSGDLLRIGVGRRAEDVGPQIVASDNSARCFLDPGRVFRGHATFAKPPCYRLGRLPTGPSQVGLGFENINRFLDRIHGMESKQHVY